MMNKFNQSVDSKLCRSDHLFYVFRTDDAITETFGYLSSMFQEDNPHNKFSDRTKPVFSQVVQDIVHHRLLEKVEKLYSSKECFIHADCHCNAVFIKDENVKVNQICLNIKSM